jgi:hypothetical protein
VVAEAMQGNAVLRAFSGYIFFFLAFVLRTGHFGVSHNVALGAMVAGASAGGLAAMAIGSILRARGPYLILFVMLVLAPVMASVCAWFFGLGSAVLIAFTATCCAGLAKLAQDSIVQREIGEEIRSSAFAVSETLNQVSNVAGALAGVLVSMLNNGTAGLAIPAAFLTVMVVLLIVRRRRRVAQAVPAAARPRLPAFWHLSTVRCGVPHTMAGCRAGDPRGAADTQQMRPEAGQRPGAAQCHRHAQFLAQYVDGVQHPRLTRRGKPVKVRTADQNRARTQR